MWRNWFRPEVIVLWEILLYTSNPYWLSQNSTITLYLLSLVERDLAVKAADLVFPLVAAVQKLSEKVNSM